MKKTVTRILAIFLVLHLFFCFSACRQPEKEADETTAQSEESETVQMVWIVATGEKYHARAGCSNMKYPRAVTKDVAEQRGYEPCKKCY